MEESGFKSVHNKLPESKMPQNAIPPSVRLVGAAVATIVVEPPTVWSCEGDVTVTSMFDPGGLVVGPPGFTNSAV